MAVLPRVTPLPHAPHAVRGTVLLRNTSFTAYELRSLLGLPSLATENQQLIELLAQREDDHRRWIAQLRRSVEEDVPFPLTTNPEQCAFGKWYSRYRAPNVVLARHLRRFDQPHRRIHEIGRAALSLLAQGRKSDAQQLVNDQVQAEMRALIDLFQLVPSLLRETTREIVLVSTGEHEVSGLIVDSVEAVRRFDPASYTPWESGNGDASGVVCGTIQDVDDAVLLALDVSRIGNGFLGMV